MIIKDINELKHNKKTDKIVIFGSGPSINRLKNEEIEYLQSFDTLSFNWFCKTNIPVKFYIITEILYYYYLAVKENNTDLINVLSGNEDVETFFKLLNSKSYNNTIFILGNSF